MLDAFEFGWPVVSLPYAHARRVERVTIVFIDSGVLGWHVHAHAEDEWCLATFAWVDHADQILRDDGSSAQLPTTGAAWEDTDQGWAGAVVPVRDKVYIADANDHLTEPAPNTAGEAWTDTWRVRWTAVATDEWRRAWVVARNSVRTGHPSPVMNGHDCR